MTVREFLSICAIVVLAEVGMGAALEILDAGRTRWLALFLLLLSGFIAHDAYGNRLLPVPNIIAQAGGYCLAMVCFVMGIGAWKSK